MSAPKVLLVQLPNPVGDVVMATPLLQVLRESLPQTKIVLAGKPMFRELLHGLTTFDDFLAAPARGSGWSGLKSQADWLRAAGADCTIILPNSWSSALAARMAGIRRRIARRAHGRALLLTDCLPKVGGARPMTRIYLEMLEPLGIAMPSEVDAPAARLFAGDSAAPQYLGLAPGAAFGPSKIYPLPMLAEAVELAQEQIAELRQQQSGAAGQKQGDLEVLLLGSPAETELLTAAQSELLARGVTAKIPPPGGFDVAKSWIAQCRVLLTMDSGARHIAAALQVPQVVLYGPTHPGWSAHSLELTRILRREEVDCLGCHHKECPIDHRCMTKLEPSAVASALMKRLN